jgi:hypothetical protein
MSLWEEIGWIILSVWGASFFLICVGLLSMWCDENDVGMTRVIRRTVVASFHRMVWFVTNLRSNIGARSRELLRPVMHSEGMCYGGSTTPRRDLSAASVYSSFYAQHTATVTDVPVGSSTKPAQH